MQAMVFVLWHSVIAERVTQLSSFMPTGLFKNFAWFDFRVSWTQLMVFVLWHSVIAERATQLSPFKPTGLFKNFAWYDFRVAWTQLTASAKSWAQDLRV